MKKNCNKGCATVVQTICYPSNLTLGRTAYNNTLRLNNKVVFLLVDHDFAGLMSPEDKIKLDSLSDGGNSNSIIVTAGENISALDLIYIDSDGLAYLSSTSDAYKEVMVIASEDIILGDTGTALLPGSLVTGFSALTPGTRFFLSDVPGTFNTIVQSVDAQFIQQIGHAVSSTDIIFRPEFPIGIAPEETFYRLLENEDIRITESGDTRILEN